MSFLLPVIFMCSTNLWEYVIVGVRVLFTPQDTHPGLVKGFLSLFSSFSHSESHILSEAGNAQETRTAEVWAHSRLQTGERKFPEVRFRG